MSEFPLPSAELTLETLDELRSRGPTLFIHPHAGIYDAVVKGALDGINNVIALTREAGFEPLVIRGTQWEDDLVADRRHIHIMMHDRPYVAPNVFHCVPSYLRGFWYFDEVAPRQMSSIRLLEFRQGRIKQEKADAFFEELRAKYLDPNWKFGNQPPLENGFEPERGCISVFTQNFAGPQYFRDFYTEIQMVEGVIASRGDRRVYIKAHPNQSKADKKILQQYHDPTAGIEVVEQNIHTLLAASDLVVTMTSAVAFEGFLHRVPCVLGGQSDFHHNAITCMDINKLGDAMQAAMSREFPFEKYLYWFLAEQCHRPQKKQQARRIVLRKMQAKGYLLDVDGGFNGFV